MLALTRNIGQKIIIQLGDGRTIEIFPSNITTKTDAGFQSIQGQVKICIDCPSDIVILREELL